ncbi:hypothetical protein [Burkholderia glumae]|uniref:hypothetical protein n=1 Tax=Burkholderia glumae TaxID=337 RepID=UPI000F5ED2DF|nr:hypothetical protein [Burkholderia glumae]
MEEGKIYKSIFGLLSTFEIFNHKTAVESLSVEAQGIVEAELKSEMERISKLCQNYESALEFAARLSLLQRTFYKAAPKAIEELLHVAAAEFVDKQKFPMELAGDEISADQAMQLFGPVMMGMIRERVGGHFRDMSALLANSVKSEAKQSAVRHGSNGGQKRAGKFAPLKVRAIELARAGGFASANHAATKIAPKILAMPEAKAIAFSSERAVQTIADWLRKEGLQFSKQRAESSGDGSA